MLDLAKVRKQDVVYDLGSGDGRIVITAAKKYGCRAIGYEIDRELVALSQEQARKSNVENLVKIEHKDIFTVDLSKASVITLYLLPTQNAKLIPQFSKLKPGSRIVSHEFQIPGVRPEKMVTVESKEDGDKHDLYLWTTPLQMQQRRN